MQILTFNIHKGFNWNNSDLTLQRFKTLLREIHPEVVFLQEVVGENTRLSKERADWIENQFEFIADELWEEFAYAKNAVFDERHHGNVILSKYPIKRSEVINISTNPLEQRGILFCELDLNGSNLHCYCVHLNLTHKGRVKQYDHIKQAMEKFSTQNEKVILAGDFNDWNQKASHHLMKQLNLKEAHKTLHGDYAKTYPAKLPLLKLDRIYLRNIDLAKIEVLHQSPWNEISDHLPLLAKVDL